MYWSTPIAHLIIIICAEHSLTCGCQNIIHIYHLMLYENGGQIGLGKVSTVVDLCVKVPRSSLICSDPLKKADHSTNLHKTYNMHGKMWFIMK